MNTNRKRNEALNIADFKIDDILSASGDRLLAEVAEDCGDPETLVAEFDAIAFPVIARHSSSAVKRGDAAATAGRPALDDAPWLNTPWSFLSEWLAASLRPRIALGAFATLLLIAILAPGIYPLLVERSADRTAPQQSSPTQNPVAAEEKIPRAMPIERPASDPKERISQINRFVNAYDGGDCFFATPISVGEHMATLEGYGSVIAPFEALSDKFKREIGFEAFIRAHRVAPQQCAAVNFLSRMRNQRAPVPSLDFSSPALRGGDALTGTVADFGNREVTLLLVADDGSVRNLTNMLRTTANTKSFNIQVQKSGRERAQPNLLLAIAESKPLEALTRASLGSADQVFGQLLVEALRDGQTLSVSAKFFTLEN